MLSQPVDLDIFEVDFSGLGTGVHLSSNKPDETRPRPDQKNEGVGLKRESLEPKGDLKILKGDLYQDVVVFCEVRLNR